MSMFNHEMICMECKGKEKQRPDYAVAEATDLREYAGRLRKHGRVSQAETVEHIALKLEGE